MFSQTHLGPSQTSAMESFCQNKGLERRRKIKTCHNNCYILSADIEINLRTILVRKNCGKSVQRRECRLIHVVSTMMI